jgi:hypothetical protein
MRSAVFEAKKPRKHALECLRLQADCMELAGVAHCRDMQSHFVFMAGFWGNLAVPGPSSNAGPKSLKADKQTP